MYVISTRLGEPEREMAKGTTMAKFSIQWEQRRDSPWENDWATIGRIKECSYLRSSLTRPMAAGSHPVRIHRAGLASLKISTRWLKSATDRTIVGVVYRE